MPNANKPQYIAIRLLCTHTTAGPSVGKEIIPPNPVPGADPVPVAAPIIFRGAEYSVVHRFWGYVQVGGIHWCTKPQRMSRCGAAVVRRRQHKRPMTISEVSEAESSSGNWTDNHRECWAWCGETCVNFNNEYCHVPNQREGFLLCFKLAGRKRMKWGESIPTPNTQVLPILDAVM